MGRKSNRFVSNRNISTVQGDYWFQYFVLQCGLVINGRQLPESIQLEQLRRYLAALPKRVMKR